MTVFFLPHNAYSVYKPPDQGIILAFKFKYKAEMVTVWIKSYSNSIVTFREMPTKVKKGLKGIRLG